MLNISKETRWAILRRNCCF